MIKFLELFPRANMPLVNRKCSNHKVCPRKLQNALETRLRAGWVQLIWRFANLGVPSSRISIKIWHKRCESFEDREYQPATLSTHKLSNSLDIHKIERYKPNRATVSEKLSRLMYACDWNWAIDWKEFCRKTMVPIKQSKYSVIKNLLIYSMSEIPMRCN